MNCQNTREPDYKSLRLTQTPEAKEMNSVKALTFDNDLPPTYLNATGSGASESANIKV